MNDEPFKDYVLMKRGFFYRPNGNGYTDRIREAGLYTKAEAEAQVYPYDEPVTMHLAKDFIGKSKDLVPGTMFDEVVKQRDTVTHDLSKLKALAMRLRIALKQIFDKSRPTMSDSGDSGISSIAKEALDLYEDDTIDEHIARLEEKLRVLKASAEKSHALIDGCGIVMTRDKTHQGLHARIEAIIGRYNQLNTLQPISTAPRDGTYVLLFGDSGYRTIPFRCEACRYDAIYRPLQPWINHSNDSFEDGGPPATHWLPIPRYKA